MQELLKFDVDQLDSNESHFAAEILETSTNRKAVDHILFYTQRHVYKKIPDKQK